jgi:hypothetical protein
MELKGSNGHVLRFEVMGYQFPAEVGDDWLMIRTVATLPGLGTWTVTDPSLETHDLRTLADWLEAVAEQRNTREDRDVFVEIPLTDVDVRGFSRWLGEQLLRFPPREPEPI